MKKVCCLRISSRGTISDSASALFWHGREIPFLIKADLLSTHWPTSVCMGDNDERDGDDDAFLIYYATHIHLSPRPVLASISICGGVAPRAILLCSGRWTGSVGAENIL